jgi:hypothetical protein
MEVIAIRTFEEYNQWLEEHLKKVEEEGVKVFKLSTTEREEFKACRRKWDFASLSRQGLEPKRPATALWFGTGIHYALEQYYATNADPVEEFARWSEVDLERIRESQGGLWDEQVDSLKETEDLGRGMLEGYVDWASIVDSQSNVGFKKVVYTEKEFQVPIRDNTGNIARFTDAKGQVFEMHLVGRWDLIVEDFDAFLWILDHKTMRDKLDPEILVLNDQMVCYLWAAQEVFQVPFAGVYYNGLRKKLPTVPKVLRAGGLSKAKNIDTTYEVYLAEIERLELDPADYEDILDHLKNKPNTFFQREKLRRNAQEIRSAGYWLWLEAMDMLNDPFLYPNMTWDCKYMCDFKDICKAMNRGDDVEWMLSNGYQKRKEDGVYERMKTILLEER